MSYARLFFDAAFTENLALTFFLGMCTFVAVSRRVETAIGLGCAVVLVQTVTVPVNCLLQRLLLRPGALSWAGLPDADIGYVGLLLYVSVVAAIIQILEMVLERFFPRLHSALGVFLPLLAVNCAILGGTLFSVERSYTVLESVAWGCGSGFGWAAALVALAGLREKLTYSDPPEGLRGLGLTFVVVGLMALGFLGLAGMRPG